MHRCPITVHNDPCRLRTTQYALLIKQNWSPHHSSRAVTLAHTTNAVWYLWFLRDWGVLYASRIAIYILESVHTDTKTFTKTRFWFGEHNYDFNVMSTIIIKICPYTRPSFLDKLCVVKKDIQGFNWSMLTKRLGSRARCTCSCKYDAVLLSGGLVKRWGILQREYPWLQWFLCSRMLTVMHQVLPRCKTCMYWGSLCYSAFVHHAV